MEIKREPLDAIHDFRVRQLLARDMLRGDLEGDGASSATSRSAS